MMAWIAPFASRTKMAPWRDGGRRRGGRAGGPAQRSPGLAGAKQVCLVEAKKTRNRGRASRAAMVDRCGAKEEEVSNSATSRTCSPRAREVHRMRSSSPVLVMATTSKDWGG